MTRFKITLCRPVYEYAEVVLEAPDEASAMGEAEARAEAGQVSGWGWDDDTGEARAINCDLEEG